MRFERVSENSWLTALFSFVVVAGLDSHCSGEKMSSSSLYIIISVLQHVVHMALGLLCIIHLKVFCCRWKEQC